MENEEKNIKSEVALREEAVLKFWQINEIFKKTLEKKSPNGEFVFFEGPPTANAKPALHHLEARAFKDVLPRYKTMQGFHVRRKAGWDTHGLPVELQIEKALGFTSKKDIEKYGIEAFNEKCKESVHEYIDLWKDFTLRIGYWVDFAKAYHTYDSTYIESLWNIVGKVNNEGHLYKDYKVVPWCPRCGTGLSSHELAQGYQDDKDLSVYAKFKIIGFDDAYFLAWTTTPWTLPGNVGLAVGKEIKYVEIKIGKEILVLAEERLPVISEPYEIIATHTGSEMVGMKYEPLYQYLETLDKGDEKLVNAYQIYPADFVNTDEGTGIVHTAVMYGQDDFELGTKVNLPKYHLVDETGHFVKGTDFLEGRFVKEVDEKGKPTLAVDIIDDLKKRGLFFKQENITHSYPHCWRCKTPLIYYARDSWYIQMSALRDKLIAENQKINWEPEHTKEGRFGEWLREVKDWAISRERYWGTPLPIWQSSDGEKIIVDSFDTLRSYTKKSGNSYFLMRHGETDANLKEIICSKDIHTDPLNDSGRMKAKDSAQGLKGSIDLIIASPFLRTQETAEIVRTELGLSKIDVLTDDRLKEIDAGEYEGKSWNDYHYNIHEKDGDDWFGQNWTNGEKFTDVSKRIGSLLYELEEKYKGKRILLVTHGGPAWIAYTVAGYYLPGGKEYHAFHNDPKRVFVSEFERFRNAEVRELPFVPLPHNRNYQLDPHRPFIDEVVLEKDGKEFHRVKEVMDVWFDSGAMPFAQDHYPFENTDVFEPHKNLFKKQKGYPADFISEAIDQTRGWFYTLLAVGVLMQVGTPYKNVICLGHLLDEKGKKMSKSIGNIVDPWEQIEKYGVDSLRLWMYSVNQPGDSKNYDEKTVVELQRQVFGLLYNVLSFYELYRDKESEQRTVNSEQGKHVLDQWILARLNQLISISTESLDTYKVLEPVRAIREFIGDLSQWYLRRSRDRIKANPPKADARSGEAGFRDAGTEAKQTLYYVLKTLAQLLAPFAPFAAEDIWLKLRNENDEESVHLSSWPNTDEVDTEIIEHMQLVRDLCTVGNALRKKSNIPVRQPLAFFFVTEDLTDPYKAIIKDELNVKAVEKGTVVIFDERITPELKAEGDYREFVRAVQELRKQAGLTPSDHVNLTLSLNAETLINSFIDEFKKTVLADNVTFAENDGEKVKVGEIIITAKMES